MGRARGTGSWGAASGTQLRWVDGSWIFVTLARTAGSGDQRGHASGKAAGGPPPPPPSTGAALIWAGAASFRSILQGRFLGLILLLGFEQFSALASAGQPAWRCVAGVRPGVRSSTSCIHSPHRSPPGVLRPGHWH